MFVVGKIAVRIGHGGRGFAQHVIAVGKALRFQPAGALQRLLDGLAGDELIAHHLHRHVDAAADHRFAGARDEPGEHRAQPGFGKARRQFAGHHQAPGGGIHKQRLAVAQMRLPVTTGDLVADQRVAGFIVGDAQQGFGQAH